MWSAGAVQAALLQALARRTPAIRACWAALLRAEAASSPLANPEALVHLIDWTLREVFHGLQAPRALNHPHRPRSRREPACPCGRNPLRAHFAAGKQALQEALVLCQAAGPPPAPAERDAALQELNHAFRRLAAREMAALCALCLRRAAAPRQPPAGRRPPTPAGRRERPALATRNHRRRASCGPGLDAAQER